MNVTESGFKNRQLHIEDYLQMVSAEQKEYAEVFDYSTALYMVKKNFCTYYLRFFSAKKYHENFICHNIF